MLMRQRGDALRTTPPAHVIYHLWIWYLSPANVLYHSGALLSGFKGVHTNQQDLTYMYENLRTVFSQYNPSQLSCLCDLYTRVLRPKSTSHASCGPAARTKKHHQV